MTQTDNDALVRTMAERFLSWKLPENFNPDGGIKFDRVVNLGTLHQYYHEPTGTNLLDFTQAKQMIEYLLAGLDLTTPHPKPLDPPAQDEVEHELIERLLDAQQDINLAANSHMDQGLADASALIDEIEPILRTALRQHQSAETEALRAENARLRTALEPFAQMAEEAEIAASALQNDRDDFFVAQIGGYKIGDLYLADFQRACAALEGGAK